jgi:hypothetical protein
MTSGSILKEIELCNVFPKEVCNIVSLYSENKMDVQMKKDLILEAKKMSYLKLCYFEIVLDKHSVFEKNDKKIFHDCKCCKRHNKMKKCTRVIPWESLKTAEDKQCACPCRHYRRGLFYIPPLTHK